MGALGTCPEIRNRKGIEDGEGERWKGAFFGHFGQFGHSKQDFKEKERHYGKPRSDVQIVQFVRPTIHKQRGHYR